MEELRTLHASTAYQQRLPITIASLLIGSIAAIFSHPIILQNSTLDGWLDASGWVLLAMGIALRSWATREISGQKRRRVVNTGPYALCRNPLYVGTFLIATSQAVLLHSVAFFVSLLIPIAVYVFGVVPAEEKYLTGKLGTAYRTYCRETPRWCPRWNSRAMVSSSAGDSRSQQREYLSLACWAFLPFLAELISYVRELPTWPHIPLIP